MAERESAYLRSTDVTSFCSLWPSVDAIARLSWILNADLVIGTFVDGSEFLFTSQAATVVKLVGVIIVLRVQIVVMIITL